MSRLDRTTATLAIRPAFDDDADAVARLAALDSAPVPAGPLLLGVVDGCRLAALDLDTGAVVSDPFSPTDELVALLRLRADRLQAATAPPRRRGRAGRLAGRARGRLA